MRQLQGPKDMPWALQHLIEFSQQVWGSPEHGIPEHEYGLVWVTKAAAEAAAEAAADFPASNDIVRRIEKNLIELDPNGLLVLFPECAIPMHAMRLLGDVNVAGFILQLTQFDSTETAYTILPIVHAFGGLANVVDLIPGSTNWDAPGEWHWLEKHSEGVVSPNTPELLTKDLRVMLSPDSDQFGRFATACLLLMLEPGVTETTTVWASRKDRDRAGRKAHPTIRRIDLRPMRYVKADHDSSGREYKHRWIVRGHWRKHWHPAEQEHHIRWIAPYIKGPEGAPMKTEPKVYVWNRI